jgi:hypothetical protein
MVFASWVVAAVVLAVAFEDIGLMDVDQGGRCQLSSGNGLVPTAPIAAPLSGMTEQRTGAAAVNTEK